MLTISNNSIEKIIDAEISSEAYYNKFLAAPSWSTGQSGVTVGIGYDLGYNTKQQISNDWKGLVSEPFLTYMQSVAGLIGIEAGLVVSLLGLQAITNMAKEKLKSHE